VPSAQILLRAVVVPRGSTEGVRSPSFAVPPHPSQRRCLLAVVDVVSAGAGSRPAGLPPPPRRAEGGRAVRAAAAAGLGKHGGTFEQVIRSIAQGRAAHLFPHETTLQCPCLVGCSR
jgi:hypothetical protein